jgi:hypothetical protein
MGGFRRSAADINLARGLVELAERRVNGPGLRYARFLVAEADRGRVADAGDLPHPPPTPQNEPRIGTPITNRQLDQAETAKAKRRAKRLGIG